MYLVFENALVFLVIFGVIWVSRTFNYLFSTRHAFSNLVCNGSRSQDLLGEDIIIFLTCTGFKI